MIYNRIDYHFCIPVFSTQVVDNYVYSVYWLLNVTGVIVVIDIKHVA